MTSLAWQVNLLKRDRISKHPMVTVLMNKVGFGVFYSIQLPLDSSV